MLSRRFFSKWSVTVNIALQVFQWDSENTVNLELHVVMFCCFTLKRLYSFLHASSFCSGQAIFMLSEFLQYNSSGRKAGKVLCHSECLSYSLFSITQRVFCSFLYCNEGRKHGPKYRYHSECIHNWVLLQPSDKYIPSTWLFFFIVISLWAR